VPCRCPLSTGGHVFPDPVEPPYNTIPQERFWSRSPKTQWIQRCKPRFVLDASPGDCPRNGLSSVLFSGQFNPNRNHLPWKNPH
jgi:hypothetical protein